MWRATISGRPVRVFLASTRRSLGGLCSEQRLVALATSFVSKGERYAALWSGHPHEPRCADPNDYVEASRPGVAGLASEPGSTPRGTTITGTGAARTTATDTLPRSVRRTGP